MKEEIISLLEEIGEDGVLQSEIAEKLNLSKSTVSAHLSDLEKEDEVIRSQVAGKSKKVWLMEEFPQPIENILRIGIIRAAEYPHVLIACQNLEEKSNIRVYNSARELTFALDSGKVDIAFSPLATQILYSLVNRNIKISAGCASKGAGIVSKNRPGKDVTYGCSQLSAMEMNLRGFLEKKEIDQYDTDIRYFSGPSRMIENYTSGETDALAIWEPYLSLLKNSDEKSEIYQFPENLQSFPCCTMGVNRDSLTNKGDSFRKFMDKYIQASEAVKRGKSLKKGAELLAGETGLDKNLLLLSFENYNFKHELDEETILKYIKRFDLKVPRSVLPDLLQLKFEN